MSEFKIGMNEFRRGVVDGRSGKGWAVRDQLGQGVESLVSLGMEER